LWVGWGRGTYFNIADFERQLSGIISGTKMNSHNLPSRDIHDWQLYGKQFCDMEFICVPEAVILQI
jgi:hypothetical protein